MEKLKLGLDALRVESICRGRCGRRQGTVAAHASGHPDCTSVYLCTLQTWGLPACTA
jgi:hypothetical protein